MSMLGIRLNLLMGPTVPLPLPPTVIEALDRLEVTHKDEGRSGFQLVFKVGRGPTDLLDFPLLASKAVNTGSRVIITILFGAIPRVLFDGLITHQQMQPGDSPGTSKLIVTGEDVSLAMDQEQKNAEHPAQPDLAIVAVICAKYAQYGLLPKVIKPLVTDVPLPTQRIPVQRHTDFNYLSELAHRYGYVFYVEPGSVPGLNTAYWGPPIRIGIPQPAITVNMGAANNTKNLQFSFDSEKPAEVSGTVQDGQTNVQLPAQSLFSTRIPLSQGELPMAAKTRKILPPPLSGYSVQQVMGIAQGMMDASFDQVVTGTGTLDTTRYDGILSPRGLVGVRGASLDYDGLYYVKSVTHKITQGNYKQEFQITRGGLGTLTPIVPV